MSDIHLQLGKKTDYIDYIFRSINYFLDICLQRNIENIFVLGDLVEYKDRIDVFVLTEMVKFFREKKNNFNFYFVVGNHETVKRIDNSVNFLEILAKEHTVFDDYESMMFLDTVAHFMPFFKDDILKEKIKEIKIVKNKKNYLFTHLSFKNFDVGGGHEDIWSEMKSEDFENIGFDHIYSGHYHKHQTKGKTTYISSPMVTNFGEKNEENKHGFVIADLKNNSFEFIVNPHTIKYRILNLDKNSLKSMLTTKDFYYRVILDKFYDSSFLEKLKENIEKTNFKVEFAYNISKTSSKFSRIKDWEEIITEEPIDILKHYVKAKKVNNEYLEYLTK